MDKDFGGLVSVSEIYSGSDVLEGILTGGKRTEDLQSVCVDSGLLGEFEFADMAVLIFRFLRSSSARVAPDVAVEDDGQGGPVAFFAVGRGYLFPRRQSICFQQEWMLERLFYSAKFQTGLIGRKKFQDSVR